MSDHPSSAPSPVASWLLAAICALVVGVLGLIACTGDSELGERPASDEYYNLLVSGFRSGQLSLKQEPPAGLATLADPYDPEANAPYRGVIFTGKGRIHDATYFQGRLYLYFGVTPALLLFWPAAAAGYFVSHQQAVALFAAAGYLLSVWLLRAVWRRYFPEASPWLVIAGALALGLGNGFPIVLHRSDVWEVPIFCGYALTMLTLVLLWRAVHVPESRVAMLALASLAYGLAVGARPSLLFGAVVLLVPVALGWASAGAARWRLVVAALGPITAVGCGLMVYNQLRFGSPFEFGQTYQLAGDRQDRSHFGLQYLWFNLRAYLFAPAGWAAGFPFVRENAFPPAPASHGTTEAPYGTLLGMPFVWFVAVLPLLWRDVRDTARRGLAWFLAAPIALFLISALVIGCFYCTCNRYEVEFVPAFVLLAAIGGLAMDRLLADRGVWRTVARIAAGVLLLHSIAFNLLAGIRWRADRLMLEGVAMAYAGRNDEASARIGEALSYNPVAAQPYYEKYGKTLLKYGRLENLLTLLDAALRQAPDSAGLHNEMGAILAGNGRIPEALPHFQEAARLEPGNAGSQANLGMALVQEGRTAEARAALQKALQLDPGLQGVREMLGQLQPPAGSAPPFLRRP